ncbi:MAG: DUF3810 family protein [Anaerolineae bacterium]
MKRLPRIIQSLFIVGVVAFALLPRSSAFIENIYSNGFYPLVNRVVTPVSNSLPVSFGDLLLIALLLGLPGWWALSLARARRGHWWWQFPRLALDTLTVLAVAYLLFALSWGLSYDREPLTARLDYSEQRVTVDGEHQLLALDVQQLNALAPLAHSQPFPVGDQLYPALHASFASVVSDLGTNFSTFGVAPKHSLLDFYFEATGVSGFTDPWTHEVILNESLLPVERPFTLAHEWGHLAGYASESEANFIGMLTCLRSDQPSIRYAGWLSLYMWLPQPPGGGPAVAPEVEADLQAIRVRIAAHENKQASKVERNMYDGYLKANRVQEGIDNYGLFVRLMLGTRFVADWQPLRRGIASAPGTESRP